MENSQSNNGMPKIAELKEVLFHAWCAETAFEGIWHKKIPTLNQCAVTALVVQDYLGGKILKRKMTNGQNHYLNRLPDGTEVDLTAAQFDFITPKQILEETSVCSRSQLTRHQNVQTRYELLKKRVEENRTKQDIPAK